MVRHVLRKSQNVVATSGYIARIVQSVPERFAGFVLDSNAI